MPIGTHPSPILAFLIAAALPSVAFAGGQPPVDHRIQAVPMGYSLLAYDDCGVEGRQPHVDMSGAYFFTFENKDNDADIKSQTAVFSDKGLKLHYVKIDPKRSYILALTYATDRVYRRVQSLRAGDVQLHPPIALPSGKAIRVIVAVPKEAVANGRLDLEIRIHGQVNATVSVVELWSTGRVPSVWHFDSVSALNQDITGRLLDARYDPEAHAEIRLTQGPSGRVLAHTKTRADGSFLIARKTLAKATPTSPLKLVATVRTAKVEEVLMPEDVNFDPVRYRPLPAMVRGVASPIVFLDGKWEINPDPDGKGTWAEMTVPGQWKQQGFDIPRDRSVLMAKEFAIPRNWAGKRVFLRFDAIHAGARYTLNGKSIGTSENLFTPVEFEVTGEAKPGQTNRLAIQMKVNTPSEDLSTSSNYAFHNLGGIDRSVRLYALPEANLRDLRIKVDLDKSYRDAQLRVETTVDGAGRSSGAVAVEMKLTDPRGRPVTPAAMKTDIGELPNGHKSIRLSAKVSNPDKWNAEKPRQYNLTVSLMRNGAVCERVVRKIGFRKIEVRGSQLLLNGKEIKLAGAGRHEIDPLTGRAATKNHAREDMALLKAANINYVRTCHYPPTMEMVEAADEMGLYLEVEAPFCWVAPENDSATLRRVLTPTSAMVDYYNSHPSVLIWSIANESSFTKAFEVSARFVKKLDPDRITTFNNPDPKGICDTLNWHYPSMPFDANSPEDKRPVLLGEYFFPVCHEQADVRIDPGLRELWGAGKADPSTPYAKALDADYDRARHLMPGAKSDVWTSIYRSKRIAGAAMFAALDDAFYFPDGTHAGYAWHHGYWGLLDVWRRPKPEYWLNKLIFSPVWFPVRHVDLAPGQRSVIVPVENRYAFTDLRETRFAWRIGTKSGFAKASCKPGSTGTITIPIPAGTLEGEKIQIRVSDAAGREISAVAVQLGKEKPQAEPQPAGGAPRLTEEGDLIVVQGAAFGLALNKKTGRLVTTDPRHTIALTDFPSVHVTRYDYGDLAGPNSLPYAVFPDRATRVLEKVSASASPEGVTLTVSERFQDFDGTSSLTLAANGVGSVTATYTYRGKDMNTREIGIKLGLRSDCQELRWRRWSEWDGYPSDQIGRTEGTAHAWRPGSSGPDDEAVPPSWPWALDQTELGTADFRGVKLNIYEASLRSPAGRGFGVYANADSHVRCCVEPAGIAMHVLSSCRMGPVVLKTGDAIAGKWTIQFLRR